MVMSWELNPLSLKEQQVLFFLRFIYYYFFKIYLLCLQCSACVPSAPDLITMWLLGIEFRASGRVAGALNCGVISPAPAISAVNY